MKSTILYSRRIIYVFLWIILSVSSLKGWECLSSSLRPGEPQIWMVYDNASLLTGSWVLFAAAAAGLSIFYVYELKYNKPEPLSRILYWVSIFGLAAITVYPIGTSDYFSYAAYARLHAYYGLNPYLNIVSSISDYLNDPFLKNIWWENISSVYGPLWTWISYLLHYFLSGFGLIPLLFGFKIIGLFIHILITMVVYRISEVVAAGSGPQAALLYGMNPLAIFELVVNAHNDGPAVLLLLVSVLLLVKARYLSGFIAVGMSAACKLTTGIAVLFLVWRTAKEKGLWYARIYIVAALLLVAIMYLFFFDGSLEGMSSGLKFPLQGIMSYSIVSIPYALGYYHLIVPVRILGLLIFGFYYILLLRKSQTASMGQFIILIGLGFVLYYLFGAYVVHRWYFLWPLAIMSAIPASPWTKAVSGQSVLIFLSYILFLFFDFEKETIVFTYLLAWVPLLYLWISKKSLNNTLG